ncbi:hypothetical protein ALC62_13080 [Cyphomyrmex costatus]|uniref:Uncharacterized protein n=1 Tax=Cyphomyrmex costatus TaxID=456900 RepID=A0A151IAD5_9HYME|nr:hypothetical protein ALC62_13080 [Cyphomyrmex costatus]
MLGDYGDAPHLLHQMHRTELRDPANRARLSGMRTGHAEMYETQFILFLFNIQKQQRCNNLLILRIICVFCWKMRLVILFTLKKSKKCTIAYHTTKCRRVENFRHIKLAVANTEAHAKKALQALRNPGQIRPRLPLHLRPFLVETFQYSERSSLLSVNNSYKNYVIFLMYRIIFIEASSYLNNTLRLLNSEERENAISRKYEFRLNARVSARVYTSIFLISPYSTVANQDKAISQNVINTAANHKDIILISDLLQPQELLCWFLDEIRDLCRL